MTLDERARQLARDVFDDKVDVHECADAMVALAKDFAAEALRAHFYGPDMYPNMEKRSLGAQERITTKVEAEIAAAVEAAAKGTK